MYRCTPRAAVTQPEAAAHPAAEGPPPTPRVQVEPARTPDQQPVRVQAAPPSEAEPEAEAGRGEAPEGEIQVIICCFRYRNALHHQFLCWGGLMSDPTLGMRAVAAQGLYQEWPVCAAACMSGMLPCKRPLLQGSPCLHPKFCLRSNGQQTSPGSLA